MEHNPTLTPRAVAFAYYLPQFYPIELNSKWWGEGFTEWVSVLRAHKGSRSPRGTTLTPGELGFYDLRNQDTRVRQGELARAGGLDAFCVYHYWSAGTRMLSEVEDRILRDGAPDFPFFLGWANHDWTLAWQNRPHDVVAAQKYDEHENDQHINFLLDAMEDPRYFRLGGRPLLLIYNPLSITEHRRVLDRWRTLAARRGIDPFFIGNANLMVNGPPASEGLDAWAEGTSHILGGLTRWARARHSSRRPQDMARFLQHRDVFWPYPTLARHFDDALDRFPADTIPIVLSGWNNVGRRSSWASSTDATPEAYAKALSRAFDRAAPLTIGDEVVRLVAINAWNEWGEGMTLEPSLEFGRKFLQATRSVLKPLVTSKEGTA